MGTRSRSRSESEDSKSPSPPPSAKDKYRANDNNGPQSGEKRRAESPLPRRPSSPPPTQRSSPPRRVQRDQPNERSDSRSPRRRSRSPIDDERTRRHVSVRRSRSSEAGEVKKSRSRSPGLRGREGGDAAEGRGQHYKTSSRSPSPLRPRRRSRSSSSGRGGGGGRGRRGGSEDFDRGNDEDGYRLHVADLDSNAHKSDLERCFGKFGPLKEIWMARSTPCFAFVVFRYRADSDVAINETDGTELCGRRIRVTPARPRTRGLGRRGFDPNMRCYQCGDRGHFSRDCPDSKWGYKRPPSPRHRGYSRSDRYDRRY